jgi:hypothetical protein
MAERLQTSDTTQNSARAMLSLLRNEQFAQDRRPMTRVSGVMRGIQSRN